jgi:formimidoylglutamate deiminase
VLGGAAAAGGARAGGRAAGAIAPGLWADLVALDGGAVVLDGVRGDMILDCFVFAGDDRLVRDVWSAGRRVVSAGRHPAREAISERYRATVARLRTRL